MQSSDRRASQIWILLLLALACQGCGSNPFASKEEYVRRGRQFAAQGRYPDAVIQYRKALQKDPSFGEAYLRYGQLLIRTQKAGEAFQALTRAADLMPASEEAKVELGNLAIGGLLASPARPPLYYETAQKIALELLARNPDSFDGLRLRGLISLADRHPKDAIEDLRRASRIKPGEPGVLTVLVQTLLAENQGAEAETLARNTLAAIRNYGPLYDTLYGYYLTANRPADAEQLMKSKVANNPQEPFYVIQLAEHYVGQKKAAEADTLLADFVARSQQYPKAAMDAGDFYHRTGRPEQAVALYQRGLESDRANRKDYLKRIAGLRMEQLRFDEATAAIDTLLKEFPNDPEAIGSRAALRMATGTPADLQKALEEFNTLVRQAPENLDFRFNLARAYRQSGQETQARTALVEILRRNPNHPAALREIADLEIRGQKPDEALQYAERLLAIDPSNIGVRLVRTSAWALLGRHNQVRGELRKLTAERPDLLEPVLQMATLELDLRNYAEAERIYQRLRTTGKFDIRPLRGLAAVYQAQGQARKALDLVQQEAKRNPEFQVRTLLASTAAQTGDLGLALATAQALVHDFPQDPAQLVLLGQLQQQNGQPEPAVASFDQARRLAPKDAVVVARYGLALMQAGRNADGIAALRESVKLQPDMPVLLNNLAWHLAETGSSLEEAQTLALQAVQKDPANASFSDTLGMAYLKGGKAENALAVFQGVVRKNPASPTYRLHLARTLIALGQPQKARTELDAAIHNRPSPGEHQEIEKLQATLSR